MKKKRNSIWLRIIIVAALAALLIPLSTCSRFDQPEETPPSTAAAAMRDDPIITPPPTPTPIPTPTPEPTPVPTPPVLERFKELLEENEDLVGWVNVPNTRIDYPVVQSDDNEYYLEHDFYQNPSIAGIPFLASNASIVDKKQSMCLNAHCMNDGTMFADVHRYKSLDYYKENPYFQFDTLHEENTYVIFAVFYMAGNKDDEFFYYYLYSDFPTEKGFKHHIDQIRYRSIFLNAIDVETDDELVLLSTCTYETDDLRVVVAGRKLREGEELDELDELIESTQKNPQPLYPHKWYDVFGGEPPEYG